MKILLLITLFYIADPWQAQASQDSYDLQPSKYVQSDSLEIIQLAHEITKGLDSDLSRSQGIHDWVSNHISYGNDRISPIDPPEMISSALYVLHTGQAMCVGYAMLMTALHRAIGLRARVVTGVVLDLKGKQLGGHEWNEIFIDGKWVGEDATFDSGYTNQQGLFVHELSHAYFNNPDLFSKTRKGYPDYAF